MNPTDNSAGEAGAKLYIPTDIDYAQLDAWKNSIGICPMNNTEGIVNEGWVTPKYNMMNNYYLQASWRVIGNYLNCVGNIYYLVFKPKNKNYDPKKNLIDHVRKKVGKYSVIIITREIDATKVHYNVLVRTSEELSHLHDHQDSRFMISCQLVPNRKKDLDTVHEYIIKESKTRYFYDNVDIFAQLTYQGKLRRRYNLHKALKY